MAAMEVAPVEDQQKQDEESSEVVNEQLTKNLLLSGVQSLAMSDGNLSSGEQTQLISATKVTLAETEDTAVEVGRGLLDMAEEVDGLLDDVKDIIDSLLDEGSEVSAQRLSGFFMQIVEEIVKNGISKAAVMIILMAAYALIRRYLKRYINEDILQFIEKLASLLYQAFVKFGILDWIMQNGGWTILKSLTGSIFEKIKKQHWAIIGGIALLITGVSVYNFYG